MFYSFLHFCEILDTFTSQGLLGNQIRQIWDRKSPNLDHEPHDEGSSQTLLHFDESQTTMLEEQERKMDLYWSPRGKFNFSSERICRINRYRNSMQWESPCSGPHGIKRLLYWGHLTPLALLCKPTLSVSAKCVSVCKQQVVKYSQWSVEA